MRWVLCGPIWMGPGGGRRMKPDPISGLDSGVGAAASAGRSRGGCPGQNAGHTAAPRTEAVGEAGPRPALPGLGNKAAAASVG